MGELTEDEKTPALCTTSGEPVDKVRAEQTQPIGQYKSYVVLCEDERKKGFVKPVRTSYTHKVCRGVTSMGRALAETYARNPWFYSGTFCVVCNVHRPLAEFEWRDGEPMDPHDPGFVQPKSADAS